MRREINAEAGNRLSLQDAVALSDADYRILEAAFEQCERLAQASGKAVPFDAVVQIAAEASFRGTAEQAADILRREGGFNIEPGPSGRLTVRRSRED